jgi:hypothetical protein
MMQHWISYEAMKTKGIYFRNNVWWWRPLAQYVLEHTKVITGLRKKLRVSVITTELLISEKEAEFKSLKQLYYLLQTGHTKKYEEAYMAENESYCRNWTMLKVQEKVRCTSFGSYG